MTEETSVRHSSGLVLEELSRATEAIDWGPWETLPGVIEGARAIFFVGLGRSGYALRMAAMRLMHLGRMVYVVGETTTPAIGPGDLLIAVSGSGSTQSVVYAAEAAAKHGAQVAAVTAAVASPLARAASHVLLIPGATKTDRSGRLSSQYAGTLFEQMTLVLLDAVFHTLWQRSGQTADDLYARHSNLV